MSVFLFFIVFAADDSDTRPVDIQETKLACQTFVQLIYCRTVINMC